MRRGYSVFEPYYFCELLGSGPILSFILMLITVILNMRQIRQVAEALNVKRRKCLKVNLKTVVLQWLNFSVILFSTVILIVGFRNSCEAFRVFVEDKIYTKHETRH